MKSNFRARNLAAFCRSTAEAPLLGRRAPFCTCSGLPFCIRFGCLPAVLRSIVGPTFVIVCFLSINVVLKFLQHFYNKNVKFLPKAVQFQSPLSGHTFNYHIRRKSKTTARFLVQYSGPNFQQFSYRIRAKVLLQVWFKNYPWIRQIFLHKSKTKRLPEREQKGSPKKRAQKTDLANCEASAVDRQNAARFRARKLDLEWSNF